MTSFKLREDCDSRRTVVSANQLDENGQAVKVIDDDVGDLDCEFLNNRQAFLCFPIAIGLNVFRTNFLTAKELREDCDSRRTVVSANVFCSMQRASLKTFQRSPGYESILGGFSPAPFDVSYRTDIKFFWSTCLHQRPLISRDFTDE
jgi:hypothetical protein